MNNNDKLAEVVKNQDFLKEAENFKTIEDFQKGFAKYGVDMTEEEVVAFCSEAAKYGENKELAEADLENVAGGSLVGWVAYRIGHMIGHSFGGGGHGSFGGGGSMGGR